jgi:hypothetical protein
MGEGALCKVEGRKTNPPFLALNLGKKLYYFSNGSITFLVSQGYTDIWIKVCFETIVTFFKLLHNFENLPDK